jgi:leucyl/phenylalanyl-tRNA--protein transferase
MRLPYLQVDTPFPPTRLALTAAQGANGLLAAGADLSVDRLVAAYSRGIFPWFSEGEPILWWSPSPRMLLHVDQFKVSRSLRKTLRACSLSPDWQFTMDTAFDQVILACAEPRDGQAGTWIMPEMQQAYARLHAAGYAHSIEAWFQGHLVGGLYCVALGRMVFGESMFSRRTDASKMALAHLVDWVSKRGVKVIDCQQNTRHLASLGAFEVSRQQFEDHVTNGMQYPALDWAPGPLTMAAPQTAASDGNT